MTPITQANMSNGAYGPGLAGNYAHHSAALVGSDEMGRQHDHNFSHQTTIVTPRSQPMSQGWGNSFYSTSGATSSHAPMQDIYTNTHSYTQSMPECNMGQHTPALAQSPLHGGQSSPMSSNAQQGLGLQTPLNQRQQQQQYPQYGVPVQRLAGENAHFS